jgi:dihydrofolate reductase
MSMSENQPPPAGSEMIISHIAAMAQNRVIGRAGGMPWHIPEDFKFFKATTMGHAMIMGRKTWESIGKPLPGRLTIVVTKNSKLILPEGVILAPSIKEALRYCHEHRATWGSECFIVGGGEIYKESLPRANRIYLTLVHQTVDGDTFYPEISTAEFHQIKCEPHLDGPVPFSFTTWERLV